MRLGLGAFSLASSFSYSPPSVDALASRRGEGKRRASQLNCMDAWLLLGPVFTRLLVAATGPGLCVSYTVAVLTEAAGGCSCSVPVSLPSVVASPGAAVCSTDWQHCGKDWWALTEHGKLNMEVRLLEGPCFLRTFRLRLPGSLFVCFAPPSAVLTEAVFTEAARGRAPLRTRLGWLSRSLGVRGRGQARRG